jgi:membrane protease YdiL (CAAX protease family)
VLTPVLAALAGWYLEMAGPDPATHGWLAREIAKAEVSRFFTRSSQVMAVLLLWPLIRCVRPGGSALLPPFRPVISGLRHYGAGFALAAGLLLALGAALCWQGLFRLRADTPWGGIGGPLTAALGAGILEEIFFRGFILALLLRSWPPPRAALACSLLFAAVHFLRPPAAWEHGLAGTEWFSGFAALGAVAGQWTNAHFLLAEFATLFAVGWVLALARLRTGRLWLSMGLHGGWVFGLQYFSVIAHGSKALRAGDHLPWFGSNLKIGLASLVVVSITGWIALRLPARRED